MATREELAAQIAALQAEHDALPDEPEPKVDATTPAPDPAKDSQVAELQRENAALRALHDVQLPEDLTLDDAMAEMAVKPDGSMVYVGAVAGSGASTPAPTPIRNAQPKARAAARNKASQTPNLQKMSQEERAKLDLSQIAKQLGS